MFSLRTLHRAAPSPLRFCPSCFRNYSVASPLQQNGIQKQKQVIFSGIQPTGIPHLGNYLGALRQWVKLQNDASSDTTLLFSIVDLHAITIKQDPSELAKWRKEMLASLLAVGLDPKRCTIFAQSGVKQHAELMWILSCSASMGYLGRMTQWKVRLLDFPGLYANANSSRANCLFLQMRRLWTHRPPTKMLSSLVCSPTPFSKLRISCYTRPPMSRLARTKRNTWSSLANLPSASTTSTPLMQTHSHF